MSGPGTDHTVYLVDDADDVRFLFRVMLERAGYQVVGEATTGAEAVEKAPALAPAVVLIDLVLPDLSGVEVLRQLRSSLPDARIVICSGSRVDDSVAEARAAGAAGWFDKSAVSMLVAKVEQILATPGWHP